MNTAFYLPLQMRELFHLEFLRWFGRKLAAEDYVLKGGVNLRFFLGSIRYSEDMDIDIQSVCDLLWKIARLNLKTPITFVLDNARYQQCRLVKDLAHQLNIDLLFLPAYSPNLNLIERLWKFVKKQCLYSKYYCEPVEYIMI